MSETFTVESHQGKYEVRFINSILKNIVGPSDIKQHFLIDRKVSELYPEEMASILNSPSVLMIDANEESKSLVRFPGYVEHLISRKVRRGHLLCAIGGGVIQDITCFLAGTLMRGIGWRFVPTTLLAQADSCIGSKSSINVGSTKNILGTFTPPRQVDIDVTLLKSLTDTDRESGLGEMLKIHAIEGPKAFDDISSSYYQILENPLRLLKYIQQSLRIKKRFIEEDEFDTNIRRLLNYGHSFGHAIESATEFRLPHGIAVSIGMDMANFIAEGLGYTNKNHYRRMHSALQMNYTHFSDIEIPFESFFLNLQKDKKNTDNFLMLVLLDKESHVKLERVEANEQFRILCKRYLTDQRQV